MTSPGATTAARQCPHCGSPMSRRCKHYCSRACAASAWGTKRANLVEDVEDLLAGGTSVEAIARSLGRSIAGIEITLRRAGRQDLSRQFNRVLARQRKALRRAS